MRKIEVPVEWLESLGMRPRNVRRSGSQSLRDGPLLSAGTLVAVVSNPPLAEVADPAPQEPSVSDPTDDQPVVSDEAAGRAVAAYLFAGASRSGARLSGDEIDYFREWLDPDDFQPTHATPLPRHAAHASRGHKVRSSID